MSKTKPVGDRFEGGATSYPPRLPQPRSIQDIYRHILDYGREVDDTTEIVGVSIEITDDLLRSLWWRPGAEPAIGLLEGAMLVAGESYPQLLRELAPRFGDLAIDGQILHGAYGPRLRNPVAEVVELLRAHPSSRRAVMPIFRRDDLLREGWPADTPCTTTVQLLQRDGRLDLFTTMRSNDAWLGLCYDAIMFRVLHSAVASVLGARRGRYFHSTSSLHIYRRDEEMVREALEQPEPVGGFELEWPFRAEVWTPNSVGGWLPTRRRASKMLSDFADSASSESGYVAEGLPRLWRSALERAWAKIEKSRSS